MGKRSRRMDRSPLPNELRGEQTSLEALRAQQLGRDPGHETPGLTGEPAEGVLVEVCLKCGKEYTFDTSPPSGGLKCDKCGNAVFRSFFATTRRDEVEEDFRASTERDLTMSDGESDVTRADILDLNNL